MRLSDDQKEALNAPLDPKNIKPAPAGKYGDYVDGHHVITEANRIFGHEWSYTITMLEQCSRVEATDKNNKPQIRIGYRCTVRVVVEGINREGAAVGVGMAPPHGEADAHESAVKEAETDALKRALRTFGNTFGLALYDQTKAGVGVPTITDEQAAELINLFSSTNTNAKPMLARAAQNTGQPVNDIAELPASEFVPIRDHLLSKKPKEQE